MFSPSEAKFAKGLVCELPYPTDDNRLIIKAAGQGLDAIYRTGYAYAKAELLLMDVRQRGEFSGYLFSLEQPETAGRVMSVLGEIKPVGQGNTPPGTSASGAGLEYAPGAVDSAVYD